MPLECFIGPCTVLEIEPGPVTGEQIDALVKPGCERVLFKSGGGAYFWKVQAMNWPCSACVW